LGGARSCRSGNNSDDEHWSGWHGFQFQSFQFKQIQDEEDDYPDVDFDNDLVIDSGSTIEATIKNPDLVSNLKASNRPLTMTTNAGKKVLNVEAEMPGVSRAYLDTEAMANILSLSYITDKYRVTMDSAVEDAFIVHLPKGNTVKFTRKKQRLYTFRVPDSVIAMLRAKKGMSNEIELSGSNVDRVIQLVDSVKENLKGFTKRQIKRAKEACHWERCIYLPPDWSLKQAI
jgi:hypothetical protein